MPALLCADGNRLHEPLVSILYWRCDDVVGVYGVHNDVSILYWRCAVLEYTALQHGIEFQFSIGDAGYWRNGCRGGKSKFQFSIGDARDYTDGDRRREVLRLVSILYWRCD